MYKKCKKFLFYTVVELFNAYEAFKDGRYASASQEDYIV